MSEKSNTLFFDVLVLSLNSHKLLLMLVELAIDYLFRLSKCTLFPSYCRSPLQSSLELEIDEFNLYVEESSSTNNSNTALSGTII